MILTPMYTIFRPTYPRLPEADFLVHGAWWLSWLWQSPHHSYAMRPPISTCTHLFLSFFVLRLSHFCCAVSLCIVRIVTQACTYHVLCWKMINQSNRCRWGKWGGELWEARFREKNCSKIFTKRCRLVKIVSYIGSRRRCRDLLQPACLALYCMQLSQVALATLWPPMIDRWDHPIEPNRMGSGPIVWCDAIIKNTDSYRAPGWVAACEQADRLSILSVRCFSFTFVFPLRFAHTWLSHLNYGNVNETFAPPAAMRHLSGLKDLRAQHVSLPRCMNLWKPNLELRMLLLLKDNAPAVDTESAIELVDVCPRFTDTLVTTSSC